MPSAEFLVTTLREFIYLHPMLTDQGHVFRAVTQAAPLENWSHTQDSWHYSRWWVLLIPNPWIWEHNFHTPNMLLLLHKRSFNKHPTKGRGGKGECFPKCHQNPLESQESSVLDFSMVCLKFFKWISQGCSALNHPLNDQEKRKVQGKIIQGDCTHCCCTACTSLCATQHVHEQQKQFGGRFGREICSSCKSQHIPTSIFIKSRTRVCRVKQKKEADKNWQPPSWWLSTVQKIKNQRLWLVENRRKYKTVETYSRLKMRGC